MSPRSRRARRSARRKCAPGPSCRRSAVGRTGASSADRRADLLSLYEQGAAFEGYERGIRTVIEAVLISPHFLYRTEVGRSPTGAAARLDPHEVANAVAFALTGKRPDAELMARAATDPRFRSAQVLREEAARLLATAESRQHLARFLRGWLGVTDLRDVNKIPALFPRFTTRLKVELDIEMDLFLDHVLREENGTLEALLGSTVTFASASIINDIYAWDYAPPLVPPAPPDPGSFAMIDFNPKLRKGVLSLGGWLAAHAPVHRSSPVDRGLAVRTRLFCDQLAPPPASAIAISPGPGDVNGTTRQKFETAYVRQILPDLPQADRPHRLRHGDDGCARELSRYRGGAACRLQRASSRKPTSTARSMDPAELADRLLASRRVRDCFVVQAFRYVEGRDEGAADACELAVLKDYFATPGRTIGELLTEMVAQPRFSERSVEP